MKKSELIFTKREIIIFLVLPIICSFLSVGVLSVFSTSITETIFPFVLISLVFNIPPIFAVILNLIFKLANIENEKTIKITKIIFHPILCLLLLIEGGALIWIFVR